MTWELAERYGKSHLIVPCHMGRGSYRYRMLTRVTGAAIRLEAEPS